MAKIKFCGECGAKLKSPGAKACIKCGSDPSKTTRFCTTCGTAKASPNAIMCTSCGNKLAKASEEKDPGIAALISVVGLFVLGAPAIGYFYLGNVRKGAIYIVATWAMAFAVVAAYIVGATTGVGLVCCLPLFALPFLFALAIVYDVYLEAKGEPPKLPNL